MMDTTYMTSGMKCAIQLVTLNGPGTDEMVHIATPASIRPPRMRRPRMTTRPPSMHVGPELGYEKCRFAATEARERTEEYTAKYSLSAEPLWQENAAKGTQSTAINPQYEPTPPDIPAEPSQSSPSATGTATRPVTITIIGGRDLDGEILPRIQAAIDSWKAIGITVKVR
jgi:hypothetical protein